MQSTIVYIDTHTVMSLKLQNIIWISALLYNCMIMISSKILHKGSSGSLHVMWLSNSSPSRAYSDTECECPIY